jgi:hypothetical protein
METIVQGATTLPTEALGSTPLALGGQKTVNSLNGFLPRSCGSSRTLLRVCTAMKFVAWILTGIALCGAVLMLITEVLMARSLLQQLGGSPPPMETHRTLNLVVKKEIRKSWKRRDPQVHNILGNLNSRSCLTQPLPLNVSLSAAGV